MSRKNAITMGAVFFWLRLALCILFLNIGSEENGLLSIKFLWILFAIGAVSDLVLVIGAWKRLIGAIWFWNIAQIFAGGLICCIAIPIVTMKAIEEIKAEKETGPRVQMQEHP